MKILVTGATGFVGREFVSKYQSIYDIYVLVRESSDISQLKQLVCTINNFSQYEDILEIFKKENFDGVVHFASTIIIEHESDELENIIGSNITYGTFLLESCKKTKVKWFINTGTYWQNYQNENYNPVNLYAATKEALEVIARYYTETSDLVFSTIKLNDTFGLSDTRNKVFSLWNKIANTGETLNMSKGEQVIDISYIEDIIYAYECMISNLNSNNSKLYNNKAYCVKSNERMSLKDLAKLFEGATGRTLNINWGGRPYRDRETMLPADNIALVPNWEQKYTLKEAIIKTIGVN